MSFTINISKTGYVRKNIKLIADTATIDVTGDEVETLAKGTEIIAMKSVADAGCQQDLNSCRINTKSNIMG